ncbi:RNA polymerase sigma factor [Dactylosporangium sp. NPDC005555]|uniref:RNA polymerase sigma factor n=1 Tax=Dactylosporangium sp. NPDC005555 TaxID=3154889 RepID=UPI0033AF905B
MINTIFTGVVGVFAATGSAALAVTGAVLGVVAGIGYLLTADRRPDRGTTTAVPEQAAAALHGNVRQVHSGDEEGSALPMDEPEFDTFFRDTMPTLRGFLMKSGGSLEQADDAAIEAMFEAYKQWEAIEHPKAWVYQVARRNLFRIRNRDGRYVHDDGGLWAEVADPGGFDALDLSEESRRVLDLLQALPAKQRSVFAMHYDGWDHAEIAVLLNMDVATVRSNLRHARERLKQQFSDTDAATRDEE